MICFVIIIGSKYLVGLANWVEVALFAVGILLLLVEIFVLPGFGVAGFLGVTCVIAGVFGMLIKNPPDKLPWPRDEIAWNDFSWGLAGLSLAIAGFMLLAWLLSRFLPRLQFLSGLVLVPASAGRRVEMPISMTHAPDSRTAGVTVGDTGEVLSTLRPIGRAKFADAIVDVVADAEFLDKGTKVEIIEIHGNRVVVKTIEGQS